MISEIQNKPELIALTLVSIKIDEILCLFFIRMASCLQHAFFDG